MRPLAPALVCFFALALGACSSDEEGVTYADCGTVSDDVTPTEFTWEPGGTPPEATGGVLVAGSYYLAEDVLYGTDPTCADTIAAVETRSPNARQALSLLPSTDEMGTLELVTNVSASPSRSSATYTVVEATLSFSDVCGAESAFPEGVAFSVQEDEFWVFLAPSMCGPEVARFVRF